MHVRDGCFWQEAPAYEQNFEAVAPQFKLRRLFPESDVTVLDAALARTGDVDAAAKVLRQDTPPSMRPRSMAPADPDRENAIRLFREMSRELPALRLEALMADKKRLETFIADRVALGAGVHMEYDNFFDKL